jgi:aryl sulfotransferase
MLKAVEWPVKQRELRQCVTDSTRWNDFKFRDGDVVIGTWSKSGTTWTQQIVAQLIFGGDPDVYGQAISPWIDGVPMPNAREMADAQTHRRVLKTHLPVDALVFSPSAKYIYVGRDARDVFWSWHHHCINVTDEANGLIVAWAEANGVPAAEVLNSDIRVAYRDWLERDAAPFPSFWDNVQSWWDVRHLPNVLLLHFAEMKADTAGTVRRIAEFLDVALDDELLDRVLRYSSFDHMKALAAKQEFLNFIFSGGGASFINKGTNDRWRDVLSDEEIAKCDRIAAERLSPECAYWLRTGKMPN